MNMKILVVCVLISGVHVSNAVWCATPGNTPFSPIALGDTIVAPPQNRVLNRQTEQALRTIKAALQERHYQPMYKKIGLHIATQWGARSIQVRHDAVMQEINGLVKAQGVNQAQLKFGIYTLHKRYRNDCQFLGQIIDDINNGPSGPGVTRGN